MSLLFIRFLTSSSLDLSTVGPYVYTRDPFFRIRAVTYAVDAEEPVQVSDPGEIEMALQLAYGDLFKRKVVFSSEFALSVLSLHSDRLLPKSFFDLRKAAALFGLPKSLSALSRTLALPFPEKPVSAFRLFADPHKEPSDDPDAFSALLAYELDALTALRRSFNNLSKSIRDLVTPMEKEMMDVTTEMNFRGVCLDTDLVHAAASMLYARELEVEKEIASVVGSSRTSDLSAWVACVTDGEVVTMTAPRISGYLSLHPDAPEETRRVLSLIIERSRTAGKKWYAMGARLSDGLIRDNLSYYGGVAGRWAGEGVQLQNLVSSPVPDPEGAVALVKKGASDTLHLTYGDLTETLGALVKYAIIPRFSNCGILSADFHAVEPTVLSWLVGDEDKLSSTDIYAYTASRLFGVPLSGVTPEMRRAGKTAEIACGYGGGPDAVLRAFASSSVSISKARATRIVGDWRAANKGVTALWQSVIPAASRALSTPRAVPLPGTSGRILLRRGETFGRHPSLLVTLPSGRTISYVGIEVAPDCSSLSYLRWTREGYKRVTALGHTLTENIVQGIARDLLADQLMCLPVSYFYPIFTVHDSVVVEAPLDRAPELKRAMEILPSWAHGLRLSVKVKASNTYC
ncbi:MAG: DNA polymerase [Porphyromonas sp.]|nr:DNA polymerase [Bacteroidales bacterium]MDY3101180.1 DNA polymerase [Porphyromonas sp.]